MLKTFYLFLLLMLISLTEISAQDNYTVNSPDNTIEVDFKINPAGEARYSIAHSGTVILKPSKLGITREDTDFTKHLTLDSVSQILDVSDSYTLLHGKRLNCSYKGKQRVFYLSNAQSNTMQIIFQVSDDGVAFRYHFPGKTEKKIKIFRESTSYHFNTSAKAFLQPCPDARTGWNFSQPSYEEYYQLDIPVGTNSPYEAGWVLPALFNDGKYWVSITEAAVDTNYCGSRLSRFSPDGEYAVQFPQPQEGRPGEPVLPESGLPWFTPWRIIAVSEGLAGLVESTLGTDLAIPARYDVSSWLKPGLASWSWVIMKDDSTIYSVQKKYIDFAARMNWEYCLIDAMWDTQIGYEKIKELADYARTKNIKVLLWYNSAGDWNTTPLEPRDKMLTKKSRKKEFTKLREMGIGGIKVDFFGGDGQSMMKYYIDILRDAAEYNLAVNFHGCTFPRGWYRTYPNLVSMESIRGEEYVTFAQFFADNQPVHCSVIPFTRNLFDPMDFTPVNFSGIPNITRRTTGGFEIASSVLFTSGITHIAETPKGMAVQKDFVQEFMHNLPDSWDDVKFIDGYPGKFVVLARRKGEQWYIAGINGEKTSRNIRINISNLIKGQKGFIITDSQNKKELLKQQVKSTESLQINLLPYGGFVISN